VRKGIFLILIAFLFSVACANLVLSEELAPEKAVEEVSAPQIDFLWGHVVSINTENGTILIGYNDIETNQDKQANISVTKDTVLENVTELKEIAPGDSASIDYTLSPSQDMIAKSIWIEKPQQNESEISPGDLQNKDEAVAIEPSEVPAD
jgi:hypothetical protein